MQVSMVLCKFCDDWYFLQWSVGSVIFYVLGFMLGVGDFLLFEMFEVLLGMFELLLGMFEVLLGMLDVLIGMLGLLEEVEDESGEGFQ